jgi:hypothetical protein
VKEFPEWSGGYHITMIGRPRVVCGLRFHADRGAEFAQQQTPTPLEAFWDGTSWCYGPKEK